MIATLPARMPKSEGEIDRLARATYESAFEAAQTRNGEVFVRTVLFEISKLGQLTDPPSPQNKAAVERITGTANREMVIFTTRALGLVIVVIQSALRDGPIEEAVDTMRTAAASQLTGVRPGLLLAQLQGITPNQLTAFAREDKGSARPSILAGEASLLLGEDELSHVVGCGFLSMQDMQKRPGVDSQSGASYIFYNKKRALWDPTLEGMFT